MIISRRTECSSLLFLMLATITTTRAFAWCYYSTFTAQSSSLTIHVPRFNTHNTFLRMGMQVKIRIVGRKSSGNDWLDAAYNMYATRLRASPVNVETTWHKNDVDLARGVELDLTKNHVVVLLDPKEGKQCTSEKFADKMFEWLDRGGSRLSFVIGGAEGLSSDLLEQPLPKLSLSDLTFTHQFARTMLVEQVYRATEIRKGSGYHK